MAVLRIDIERALDELSSQEEGMRFQGLAVVLGKIRWPELVARQRKKDSGLDAYAPASQTPEKVGKGLAASITPTLKKISDDAENSRENFPDLRILMFVTSGKVGNADRKRWEETIQKDHGLQLLLVEREEVIAQLMMPENARLCASFLHINIKAEPQIADLIARTKRAADAVTRNWAGKTKGQPLIELAAERLDPDGAKSADMLSLKQIDEALSQSRRIVLEGPAGRGKTTTLVQLAQRARTVGIPIIVELPLWTSSHRGILEYISCMHPFQAEGLTAADLARVHQSEPFLLLLNGWNEIAESNSAHAGEALAGLERDFPSAGIIIATRTHHLVPPLPGAIRLRLLRLGRMQRADYLRARIGARFPELRARIDTDPSLDELTRTPLILSGVASLFEAGVKIPSTKIGVLGQVLLLQEQRDEHRNTLQAAPIFGQQTDFLEALANEMTRRGAVSLPEADARAVTAAIARKLVERGQIAPTAAPVILATLTAHHVLERVDYPQTTSQFEHQQLQEYYAARDVRAQLLGLRDDDHDTISRFTADYVNNPVWAEPLRMIAETFAEQSGDVDIEKRNTRAGVNLIKMALAVDPVFAGELARLCGAAAWQEVRAAVGERLRNIYAIRDKNYRRYGLAAMLATGAEDFSDIVLPLLSSEDQQTRLSTYRLWPDFQFSSLGSDWRKQVRGWKDEARADFTSELLHHRVDSDVAAFAAEDECIAVKKAAVAGLMWTGSDDMLTRVLESMDAQTFEEVARMNSDRMPAAFKANTVVAMWKFMESTTDHFARLRTALGLIRLGETNLEAPVKSAIVSMSRGDVQKQGVYEIQPALEHLRNTDPAWVSEWVAIQMAEGGLHEHEDWLPFVTASSDGLAEKYLQRLESENLKNERIGGMIAVIAARSDSTLAARVFAKLRELRRKMAAEPDVWHEFEGQVTNQLEDVFCRFPDHVAIAGILASVANGEPLDIKVVTHLLSKVDWSNMESLRVADDGLKSRLRTYLKSSVNVVLNQDDFSGYMKANLATSIARIGIPEDVADLVKLIRADIERIRRGQAARAAGDRGPVAQGSAMRYSNWNIAAVVHLDPAGAEQVLIDLLPEPEYATYVAAAMAREFIPKRERSYGRAFSYDLMWAAREGRVSSSSEDRRRTRFSVALNAEIKRLREEDQKGNPTPALKELAKALAAIDGRGSMAAVLDVIAVPGQWDQYVRLDSAELLLMAGVALPAALIFGLVDHILERIKKANQYSEEYLLIRALAICPFVDEPEAGIDKVREIIGKRRLCSHEFREIVTALGQSRSNAAVDLLLELASDAQTFEDCEEEFINAFAALDTQRTREFLLSFVDPGIRGIARPRVSKRDDVLIAKLTELAERKPVVAAHLLALCDHELPEFNRQVLSRVMVCLGTPDALAANLNLIDDSKSIPVPRGVWDHLSAAFVERRPYGESSHVFTEHARASNDIRGRLFRMANDEKKRQRSAFMLLGQIEEWRLRRGRPTEETRHPDLVSGRSWPPTDSFLAPEGIPMSETTE